MQQGWVNRLWVNLVSIHGVPWSENITLLWWKIAASHPPIVGMLTKSKILQLTHCTLKKQWHYRSKKNNTNCVVTRRAILNPLLTTMSNL